jgi:cytoskeletal protein CcmA (bactofilin family)
LFLLLASVLKMATPGSSAANNIAGVHAPIPVDTSHSRRPLRFGAGLVLDGDLSSGDDLIIEGRVNGTIHVPENAVTIAAGGTVRGRVFARVITVLGTVQGDVNATGLIEAAEGSRIEADLIAPAIAIAEGAFIVGRLDMRRAGAAARVARYRYRQSGDAGAAEGAAEA